MVRFLHTSDWQIGMRGGGLGRAAPEVRRHRIEAVERLLRLAVERSCDFVVAAGDLFEHHGVDQAQVEEVARRISAFPTVDVHAIPGNHDLAGPGAVWNRAALRNLPNLHVHVAPGGVQVAGLGVTLWPFPVRSKHARTDPLAAAESVADRPGVHVAIAHGHLTTVTFGAHEVDVKLPVDPLHVDRCGFDYLALGHWHGTRLFHTGDGAARIAYSGTPERTAYEEVDAGQVLVVEVAEKGASPVVEPVEVGGLRWADVEFRFAGDAGGARLRRALEEVETDLLRLTLSGEAPASAYGEVRSLLEETEERVLDLRVRDGALAWRADEGEVPGGEIADGSLAEVEARLRRRVDAAADARELAVAREALRLFRQAAGEAGACG